MTKEAYVIIKRQNYRKRVWGGFMEQKQHRKESVIHLIYRLVMIIFGAACAAVAIELF